MAEGHPLLLHLVCQNWFLGHLPGGKSEGFLTDPLDRPGLQVLQTRQEGLELPGREGWIPHEVPPHGSEGGLADSGLSSSSNLPL